MDYTTLDFAVDGSLARITLNRPDKLNALSPELLGELGRALDQLTSGDTGARCLLITGTGRAFSSGADLGAGFAATPDDGPGGIGEIGDLGDLVASRLKNTFHPVFERLATLPMPIVAGVNGPAAGAGMSLALVADVVIAARSAYFLQAFINIGLIPDSGSTWLLPRIVGKARASAMMMLGEKIPAEMAEEWGLIYKCVDDGSLMDEATAIAAKLANGPTVALSAVRESIAASGQNNFATQLELEADLQARAARSADSIEGVTAFLEKRPADFKGH